MSVQVWLAALVSIALSSVAQLMMKIGMAGARGSHATGMAMAVRIASNPYVVAGFAAYGVGAVLWLLVLSRIELSVAYPLVSLGFVFVAILSWLVLGEHLPPLRLAGLVLIIAGVALVGLRAA